MKVARFLLALSCLCAVSSAEIPGLSAAKRFPIGIYDVDDPRFIRDLRGIGFDSIETGNSDPDFLKILAEESRKQGMRLLLFPHQLRKTNVAAIQDWPIEAWYLQDEPDVHDTPADKEFKSAFGLDFGVGSKQGHAAQDAGRVFGCGMAPLIRIPPFRQGAFP